MYEPTLQEATLKQISDELKNRGQAHVIVVETIDPGPTGKEQAHIILRGEDEIVQNLIYTLTKTVEGMQDDDGT